MNYSKRIAALALTITLIVGIIGGAGVLAVSGLSTVAQKTGVTVYSNQKASIDASNLTEGYVIIKYTGGGSNRIRVQITKDTTYTYDLNNGGKAETYPLTEGNGSYTVRVLENTSGTKYAISYSTTLNVSLRNQFLPFLYPNQYVNYNSNSAVVSTAKSLTSGKSGDVEKLKAIYNYVVDNFKYDYDKAKTVQSGYLPNVDAILSSKKGICFDYAAVMSAMLRSQNIPCKLVVGYAGTTYHAWVNVYVEGNWVEGAIYYDGVKWSLLDPTYLSSGNKSEAAKKYVANTKNYSQKYAY